MIIKKFCPRRTSQKVASCAAKVLNDPNSTPIAKRLAGSALVQAALGSKRTSKSMASLAGRILKCNHLYRNLERHLAGSVLSQRDQEIRVRFLLRKYMNS